MNKYFKEMITKNALERKLSAHVSGSFADALLDEVPSLKAQFKNVCAPIPMKLNDELESVTDLLGFSKREFLTLAIASAIDEAKALMVEIDIDEYFVDSIERQQQDEAA